MLTGYNNMFRVFKTKIGHTWIPNDIAKFDAQTSLQNLFYH